MSMSARKLREQRKNRIAARKKKAAIKARKGVKAEGEGEEEMGDEMPEDLLEQLDDEGGEEPAEPMESMDDDEGNPADLEEEDEMPSDLPPAEGAYAAFNYNPVYQKPVKMGMNKPAGGYHYFGPPPDAGTSYGFYRDVKAGVGIIAPKAKKVISPATGKTMKFEGDVDVDALASVLAIASEMQTLKVGEEDRMTSLSLDKVESPLFDTQTGQQLDSAQAEGDDPEMPPPTDEETPPEETMEDPMDDEEEEEGLPPMDDGADDAESVEYEALQSIDDIDEPLSEGDVHMTLFDEGTAEAPGADPFWNIDVGGQPVARVYLKDQPKPDEIRKVFCSADYYQGVSGAIAKVGLKSVLKQIKARVWANKVNETKLAKDIEARVEKEANSRVTATTQNLMREMMDRIAIVCAGMDKNFYRETGNPLKEALWAEMHAFGIANPSPIIEAAFKKGSTDYFRTVLAKAVEYLEYEPKALEQIKATIGEMDVMPAHGEGVGDSLPEADLDEPGYDPETAPTLSDRLAASSVAISGVQSLVGDPRGEHKTSLKSELRLGGAGPRVR